MMLKRIINFIKREKEMYQKCYIIHQEIIAGIYDIPPGEYISIDRIFDYRKVIKKMDNQKLIQETKGVEE